MGNQSEKAASVAELKKEVKLLVEVSQQRVNQTMAKELTQMRNENKNLVDGLDIMIKSHFKQQVEVTKERDNLDKIIKDFRNKEMKELIWYRDLARENLPKIVGQTHEWAKLNESQKIQQESRAETRTFGSSQLGSGMDETKQEATENVELKAEVHAQDSSK